MSNDWIVIFCSTTITTNFQKNKFEKNEAKNTNRWASLLRYSACSMYYFWHKYHSEITFTYVVIFCVIHRMIYDQSYKSFGW